MPTSTLPTTEPAGATAVVEMHGITVRFPGVLALDGVDFTLRPGEIHALMGENGAGKSTLIKALTGVYAIDTGDIRVGGEERVFASTADAKSAGVSTVYQEVNLCPNLSVGENVMLGHEPRGRGRIDWQALHRTADEHLRLLGVEL
ncbi:MAG: sugar ABC transporter ATP-binding protein, partial [Anaerolineae bacterium]|nr:sugar ABC transporter ATP-binding protein [Anaerolineae bacterium]